LAQLQFYADLLGDRLGIFHIKPVDFLGFAIQKAERRVAIKNSRAQYAIFLDVIKTVRHGQAGNQRQCERG